jgi:hypothetical protein
MSTQDQNADMPDALNSQETAEEHFMYEQLQQNSHSDFISNILFSFGGFIVSKPVKNAKKFVLLVRLLQA